MKNSVSVVIPVYNSCSILDEMVSRLGKVLCNYTFEIILVNDGSTDKSFAEIKKLGANLNYVRGLDLNKNFGQHNALLCGIRQAKYKTIVTIDDDLQFLPEEIPLLVTKLNQGYDLVYGVPIKSSYRIIRKSITNIAKKILVMGHGRSALKFISPFRAFNSNLKEVFRNVDSSFSSLDAHLLWGTDNISPVPVTHALSRIEKSRYSASDLVSFFVSSYLSFNRFPLYAIHYLGIFMSFAGLAWLLMGSFSNSEYQVRIVNLIVPLVILFTGLLFMLSSLLAFYLSRNNVGADRKPSYVVKQKINL